MANPGKPTFQHILISDIGLLEDNPREITDEEFKKLCEDIKNDPNFLIQLPPLVNHLTKQKKNICYAGNQRLKAARYNGLKEIGVWVERDVPKKLQEERMMKDNLHRGQWNIDLLSKYETSFLLNVGFKGDELNDWFKDLLETNDDNFDFEKEVKKIKTPTTKKGDIYELGTHKLLCGNSTNIEDVGRLMGEDRVNMIYCDPPYNIGLSYDKGIKGNSTKVTYTDAKFNDNKKPEEYMEWLTSTIRNALSVSNKKGSHIFYWCDPKNIGLVQTVFKQTKIKNKSVCFWIKNQFNPVTQMAFNRITEPCIYGTFGKPELNKKLKTLHEILNKGVNSKQIYDIIFSYVDLWLAKKDIGNNYVYPTQKPITLHEKPLKRCTNPNGIVLDLFGGSGSTLIACEQMQRQARLVEQDPVFCDVIVKRWEKFTNKKAKKYGS